MSGARRAESRARTRVPAQAALSAPTRPVTYDTPIEDISYTVDICGPEGSGKSHFARTHPGDIVWIETPPEWGKFDVLDQKFRTMYKDETVVKLKRVEVFDDIRQTLRAAILDDSVRTIVIDSGTHLRPMAGDEWCQEQGRKAVYPPTEWQYPNQKIEDLIGEVKRGNKILVVTNRLHDEYIGETTTGRQVRHGHKSFTYDFHLSLEIVDGLRGGLGGTGKTHLEHLKFGLVKKSSFWGVEKGTNLNYGKPYLFDISYNGVLNELVKPWGPHLTYESYDKCVEEAMALYGPPKEEKKTVVQRGGSVPR